VATQSDLSSPDYVTAASGNLYITDTGSDCVKEVAGTGHAEFTQSMTADYIYDIADTGDGGIPTTQGLIRTAHRTGKSAGPVIVYAANGNSYTVQEQTYLEVAGRCF
jgi:hypothetical protein